MITSSTSTITRIERLVWVFIYGGLLTVVLGIASLSEAPAAGWSMLVVGSAATLAGVVLIWVRSRMDGSQ